MEEKELFLIGFVASVLFAIVFTMILVWAVVEGDLKKRFSEWYYLRKRFVIVKQTASKNDVEIFWNYSCTYEELVEVSKRKTVIGIFKSIKHAEEYCERNGFYIVQSIEMPPRYK